MINQRIDLLLRHVVLWSVLSVSWGSVWAASSSCTYAESDSGIGGTGISGSGMGGTGAVAKGTGIGGTGIRPKIEIDEMLLAGHVIFSQGTVEAQSNGRSRLLAKGDPVCVGETIMTSQAGMVQIRMTDDGLIAVRPQTQLRIEEYSYSRVSKDNSLIALLKGTCRVITGKIGKQSPQNDVIKTATATIGVRGTDHEATVILPDNIGGYPSGTYDKVNQGITFIRTEKGEIDIHPNQVGFAASAGDLPTILKDVPVFYTTNPSMGHERSLSKEGGIEDGLGNNKLHDKPDFKELSEPPKHQEMPETPELHELPEVPELPEMPELPEVPEPPELFDS